MSGVRGFPGVDYDRWKTTEPPALEEPTDDRCDACGEHVCEDCGGCVGADCEGRLCTCMGIPDDRWADALDAAADAWIDDAKVIE